MKRLNLLRSARKEYFDVIGVQPMMIVRNSSVSKITMRISD